MTQIPVGTNITIQSASLTLLDGSQVDTSSPRVLSQTLFHADRYPRDDEPPSPYPWRRIGYEKLTLHVDLLDSHLIWTHQIGEAWQWPNLSNYEVVYVKGVANEGSWVRRSIFLDCLGARVLAALFASLRRGPTVAYIPIEYIRMGSLSHVNFVGLELKKSRSCLARGRLTLYTDDRWGHTYRWLYDLERGRDCF